MTAREPIDPRVRLAISQWPDDAPRAAVSTFREHGISRKSLYELRKRALIEGPTATPKAEAPRPKPHPPVFVQPAAKRHRPQAVPKDLPPGTSITRLTSAGTSMLAGVHYKVDGRYGFQEVLVITDGDKITIADLEDEILIEHAPPAPGVTYLGNGRPRGRHPSTPETSPKS